MARPRKDQNANFIDLAKQRYEELQGMIGKKQQEMEKIKEEMVPIRTFLTSAGVIEKQKRGRRKA